MAPKTKNMILFCRIRSPLYIFIKLEISHLLQIRLYFSHWLLKSIFQKLLFNFICRGKIKLFAVFMCFHQKSKMFFLLQQNIGIISPFLIRPFWWSVLYYFNHSKSPKIVEPTKTCKKHSQFPWICFDPAFPDDRVFSRYSENDQAALLNKPGSRIQD